MTHSETPGPDNRLRSPYIYVVVIAFLAIAGFYLVMEHRAHIYQNLSWILFGAFLLLHIWMHAGHGHGGHGRKHRDEGDK